MDPWLRLGALLGLVGVAAGAFGAHGLKGRLTPEDLAVFEVAVRYQMFHALALVAYGLAPKDPVRRPWPGILFAVGVAVFSGSLYLLVLVGPRSWGMVTPLGGLALMGGWAALAAGAGLAPARRAPGEPGP